jgi:hypothetical protein
VLHAVKRSSRRHRILSTALRSAGGVRGCAQCAELRFCSRSLLPASTALRSVGIKRLGKSSAKTASVKFVGRLISPREKTRSTALLAALE